MEGEEGHREDVRHAAPLRHNELLVGAERGAPRHARRQTARSPRQTAGSPPPPPARRRRRARERRRRWQRARRRGWPGRRRRARRRRRRARRRRWRRRGAAARRGRPPRSRRRLGAQAGGRRLHSLRRRRLRWRRHQVEGLRPRDIVLQEHVGGARVVGEDTARKDEPLLVGPRLVRVLAEQPFLDLADRVVEADLHPQVGRARGRRTDRHLDGVCGRRHLDGVCGRHAAVRSLRRIPSGTS